MSKQDAAVTKVLVDLGLRKEPELTPSEEDQLTNALDPELQYLQDIEDLFTPSEK